MPSIISLHKQLSPCQRQVPSKVGHGWTWALSPGWPLSHPGNKGQHSFICILPRSQIRLSWSPVTCNLAGLTNQSQVPLCAHQSRWGVRVDQLSLSGLSLLQPWLQIYIKPGKNSQTTPLLPYPPMTTCLCDCEVMLQEVGCDEALPRPQLRHEAKKAEIEHETSPGLEFTVLPGILACLFFCRLASGHHVAQFLMRPGDQRWHSTWKEKPRVWG